MNLSTFSLPAILVSFLAGCSGEKSEATPDVDAGTGGTDGAMQADAGMDSAMPGPPTFTDVYFDIVVRKCGGGLCHDNTAGGNLAITSPFDADAAWNQLVNQPAAGAECMDSGLIRIVPGEPDQSLFYLKMTAPPCGDPMPSNGTVLSPDELETVRTWIENGAEND